MKQMLLGLVVVVALLGFLGIGLGHVLKPDWFMKRSGIRRGGEMLTEYNRVGFQIVGLIFAALAAYLLYSFLRH